MGESWRQERSILLSSDVMQILVCQRKCSNDSHYKDKQKLLIQNISTHNYDSMRYVLYIYKTIYLTLSPFRGNLTVDKNYLNTLNAF